MNELKQFKDLVFKQHEMTKDAFLLPSSTRGVYMNAKHAKMQFENGYGISVLKGTLFYSNGIDTYEVAVLDNNGICYNTSITNDVIGYVDADEVSNIMKQIQELPPVVQ